MFEKVLRAFETGGLAAPDVLVQLRRLLATGASPSELLEILRRRQSIEPLPEDAHQQILGALDEAIELTAKQSADADPASAPTLTLVQPAAMSVVASSKAPRIRPTQPSAFEQPPDDEFAIDLDFDPFSKELTSLDAREPDVDLSLIAQTLRSGEDPVPAQHPVTKRVDALPERARQAQSAAEARAAELSAQLAAAHAALQAEQSPLSRW